MSETIKTRFGLIIWMLVMVTVFTLYIVIPEKAEETVAAETIKETEGYEQETNETQTGVPDGQVVEVLHAPSGKKWRKNEKQEPVESITESGNTEETSSAAEDVARDRNAVHYAVNGAILDYGLQEWALECLTKYGHPEYYPYFLAQMYQESSFEVDQITAGLDYGICQLRITSHDWFKDMSGRYDWDLCNSVYDNIECGAFLMSRYLTKRGGDIELALSDYISGEAWYDAPYIQQVTQWYSTIQELEN